ncbi:MAG TPA: sigma-70 family RNA polymerase sigma factor [Ureibacillus sp.]|nr:sigma-70 family RNA polymerase sigma factor [Ureibacillus sp.]
MLELVRKAQKGNDKAFLALFQEYEQEIYRIAFAYVKNQSDALDVVQDTAYRSFMSIKNLKEPKYFKTWLIKIAISCSIDILRKKKKVLFLKPNVEEIVSDNKEEDEVILGVTLRDLIDELDENEKSIILLKFYEDFTFKEISETLEMPLGTTKTIFYRALQKLRNHLKGDDVYAQLD